MKIWITLITTCAIVVGIFHLRYAVFASKNEPPNIYGEQCIDGVVQGLPEVGHRFIHFIFQTGLGKLKLAWYGWYPKLKPGDIWHLCVKLKPPHVLKNPGDSVFKNYLIHQGIAAIGYVKSAKPYHPLGQSLSEWMNILRYHSKQHLLNVLKNNDSKGLILALLLGDRSALSDTQKSTMRSIGISHLIAISGLHIGLVAVLGFYLSRCFIWVVPRQWLVRLSNPSLFYASGALLAGLYAVIAGLAVSTQRALLMLLFVMLSRAKGYLISPWQLWFWVLCLVLIWQPMVLLTAGFWLSFLAVASLIYGLYGRVGQQGFWWNLSYPQWVMFILMLPITLYLFHRVTIVSFIANLIAIPLTSFLVVPLLLFGFVGSFVSVKIATNIFHWVDEIWSCFTVIANAMNELAQLFSYQVRLDSNAILFGGLCVVLLMLPRGVISRRIPILLLFAIPIIWPLSTSRLQEGSFRMTVLDVGQGQSVLIETRHHALLYDAGPKYLDHDAGQSVIFPVLKYKGIHQLDHLILSHMDNDHAGGAGYLIGEGIVGQLLTPHAQPVNGHDIQAKDCLTDMQWHWDGVNFHFFTTQRQRYKRARNAGSCVLHIQSQKGSVLLPGDISHYEERSLVEKYGKDLSAAVLLAPHHGSATASSDRFIKTVHPEVVVFSTAFQNGFQFPRHQVIARYSNYGVRQYNTAVDGAIAFTFDQQKSVLRAHLNNDKKGVSVMSAFPLTTWLVLLLPMPLLLFICIIGFFRAR